MVDDIRSQQDGGLNNGGAEGVVGNDEGSMLVSDLRDGVDINNLQGGVGRSLNPNHLSVFVELSLEISQVCHVKEIKLNSELVAGV